MAKCPFAQWHQLSGSAGRMNHDPAKIVHHTTEGSSAAGAMSALGAKHADSHFVVGLDKEGHYGPAGGYVILQLIDTSEAARALRNAPGGVETNKDNAIQIEMVGEAGKPKDPKTLALMAKLCRWIEQTHGVALEWPNGLPNPPRNGQDPGHHNRDANNWTHKSGHYGHCHVPENTHWDPAYTADEVAIVMGWATGGVAEASAPETAPAVKEAGPAALEVHDLAWAQRSLNQLGYADPDLKVDGLLGSKTGAALRVYQADAGLTQSKQLDDSTIKMLVDDLKDAGNS